MPTPKAPRQTKEKAEVQAKEKAKKAAQCYAAEKGAAAQARLEREDEADSRELLAEAGRLEPLAPEADRPQASAAARHP